MDSSEFERLQYSLVWVFSPVIQWLGAFMVASGIFAGVFTIFMGLFRWLTRK